MQTCICGTGNGDSAKFCAECGRTLGKPACPACGAQNAAGAAYCTGCGASLRPAGPRLGTAPGSAPPTVTLQTLIGPVRTVIQAQLLTRIATAACGLIGVTFAFASLGHTHLEGWARAGLFIAGLLYGVFALGYWRGVTAAAFASLVAYVGAGLLGADLMSHAKDASAVVHALRPLIAALTFAVLPAILINGLRACIAWNRFRRGEATPEG